MIRLGILGSTRGTNMLAILKAIEQKRLTATIPIVLSNKRDALILQHANANHLSMQFVDSQGLSREAYDHELSTILTHHSIDLVVLIGYMRILSNEFVTTWNNKIINVHPSLLPAFAGKMDLDVHRAVLLAGVKETGCTVHYVTNDLDAGPVLLQKTCPVLSSDTPELLKKRVQQLEAEALVEVIAKWSE